ncbi:hypothetical protein OS493_037776 [Desmophyllum pertusum]|uniref:Uncharacterized protein n=1 Tax=Desmophyllum pertusum TaxID=174260 RepID=A0A9X0CIZ0_9CNID|nr:hypothetical protein OS493_037776 [Desmophyllum pertusum]
MASQKKPRIISGTCPRKELPRPSVALAQILAFQGKWDEVLDHGKIFLQNIRIISYNYWPFQEAMRKLITRAVKITGRQSQSRLYDYERGKLIRVYLDNEGLLGCETTNALLKMSWMWPKNCSPKDGKDSLAWEVISKKLKTWQPYENHEVAPIDLLNDDVLFGLMSPQRCEAVLSTKYENKLKRSWEIWAYNHV